MPYVYITSAITMQIVMVYNYHDMSNEKNT